jgi:hypothetical protein
MRKQKTKNKKQKTKKNKKTKKTHTGPTPESKSSFGLSKAPAHKMISLFAPYHNVT